MCTCKPGTYEDGWQERRCQHCLDVEMRVWKEVIELWVTDPPFSKSQKH